MTHHAMTTLNEIREHSPCEYGWKKLLAHLGKTKADDEPLHLLTILESNGLDNAMWCLRAKSLDRLSRHFQAWCAEQVLHHFEAEFPDDMRARDQIAMLRNDDATQEQRDAARDAARLAALEAGFAALAVQAVLAVLTAPDARASAWASTWVEVAQLNARAAQEAQLRAMIGTPQ